MLKKNSETEIGDYFRANLLAVRRAIGSQDFKRFSALKTDGQRVAFVLGYPEAHLLSLEVTNFGKKDPEKALKLKENGNKFFGSGDYPRALEIYSNAVLLASQQDLGVIFANRSAALYHLERYELALADLEEALRIGYPEELLYKLEERRAKCLLALKIHARAIEAFRRTLTALDRAKISAERKQKIESDVRVMLAVMEKGKKLNDTAGIRDAPHQRTNAGTRKTLPKVTDSNSLYPACSNAVEIRDAGGTIGRHAVATRDLLPGEVLVVEKSHCAVLLAEYRLTHCQLCFSRMLAPFPAACNVCSAIAYCSNRCRNADAKVHEKECNLLTTLWYSGASVTCSLAIKALTQRSFDEMLKFGERFKTTRREHEVDELRPYGGKDYETFHGLVTHEDERTAEDLFHRAYMAGWLLRLLKRSSYLPEEIKTPDEPGQQLSDGELLTADLLLHNLQLLQFNAHEISELVRSKGDKILANAKSILIGGGVYPTVALFNHSCNPGVVRYFIGTTMVVRTVRTIQAGEEICENYGPIFTSCPESERKRKLRLQYWFDCACEACTGHWPLLEDIDTGILKFKCETGPTCGNIIPLSVNSNEFTIACSKCKKSTNVLKGLKALQDTDALFRIASKYLEEGQYERALKSYLEVLKILDETLALPIRDYHMCQQGVRMCLLTLGNTNVISK